MQHKHLVNFTSSILSESIEADQNVFSAQGDYGEDDFSPDESLSSSLERLDEDGIYRYPWQVNVILLVGYMSVFVIGLVGNLCVIVVVMRTPRMRGSVTNRLIVNLACVDIVVLLICVPSNLLANLIYREYLLKFERRKQVSVSEKEFQNVLIQSRRTDNCIN